MQVKEKVFILKKTRYGDADLILNCLSPTGARISLFARSALKSKKRFGGGVLEPTHYVHVVYEDKSNPSRSEHPLHNLKEASLLNGFEGLRTDFSRIELGLYLVRLISDVTREGDIDSAELFNLLGNTLRAAESSQHLEHLKVHFEVKLLANQGVLQQEAEEAIMMKVPIADHERLPLVDWQWNEVKARIRGVMAEYLGQTASIG